MHLPASPGSSGGGRRIQTLAGNRRLMDEQGVAVSADAAEWARGAEGRGYTCAFVAGGGRCVALDSACWRPTLQSPASLSDLVIGTARRRLSFMATLLRWRCSCAFALLKRCSWHRRLLAVFAVTDPVKPEAAGVIAALQVHFVAWQGLHPCS